MLIFFALIMAVLTFGPAASAEVKLTRGILYCKDKDLEAFIQGRISNQIKLYKKFDKSGSASGCEFYVTNADMNKKEHESYFFLKSDCGGGTKLPPLQLVQFHASGCAIAFEPGVKAEE